MRILCRIALRRKAAARFLCVSTAFFILATSAAHAQCEKSKYNFNVGTEQVDTHWRVKAGTTCSGNVQGGNGHIGLTSFHEVTIASGASHGLASVVPFFRYVYKPAAGFSGKDHFAIKIKFDVNGVEGETRVDYDVDVVDEL